MPRPFAGVLDLGDGSGRERALRSALRAVPGDDVEVREAGPLVVGARGRPGSPHGVICVLDGGLYNGVELAEQLGLEPAAPAETVLALGFRRWGTDLARRLRGELAALLWDQRDERGLLLQDQLGVRRVFMCSDGSRLWFGSEVRNVLALLPSRPAPDPVAVSFWLSQLAAPEGATLYRGVAGLEGGQLVELSMGGWRRRRYWQPTYRPPPSRAPAELVEEIRASLRRAVERRVTPGAPTGVLMSGGLDSTSVAALAHEVAEDGAIAFSACFPGYPGVDESRWIDALESHVGLPTVRHEVRGPGLIASGLEFLREWELPLHAWSEAWIQPVLRPAGACGVRAILGGEGGDELFGSRYYLIADLLRGGHPLAAARLARGLPEVGGRAPRKAFMELLWRYGVRGAFPAGAETAWQRFGPGTGAAPWWASKRCAQQVRIGGQASWRRGDAPRWWSFHTHVLTTRLHGFGLLDHVRRRSEQRGLEARHPMLDVDLFELMMAVDPALCSRGRLTRPLLREAMAGLSPDAVRLRGRKTAFNQVMSDALAGPELEALRMILGNATQIWDYADRRGVHELLQMLPPLQRDPVAVWASHVLRLAAIELWLRYQEDASLPGRLLEDPRVPKG